MSRKPLIRQWNIVSDAIEKQTVFTEHQPDVCFITESPFHIVKVSAIDNVH